MQVQKWSNVPVSLKLPASEYPLNGILKFTWILDEYLSSKWLQPCMLGKCGIFPQHLPGSYCKIHGHTVWTSSSFLYDVSETRNKRCKINGMIKFWGPYLNLVIWKRHTLLAPSKQTGHCHDNCWEPWLSRDWILLLLDFDCPLELLWVVLLKKIKCKCYFCQKICTSALLCSLSNVTKLHDIHAMATFFLSLSLSIHLYNQPIINTKRTCVNAELSYNQALNLKTSMEMRTRMGTG